MKRSLAILATLTLTGCVSMPEITPEQAAMSRVEATSKAACYQSQQMMSGQMWGAVSKVPDKDRAMAMMLMANQLNTQQMMAVATGRSMDPCGGDSNFHDVEIQYLKSQTELTGEYLKFARWGVGMGLGYLAVDSIVDSLADAGTITYAATDNAKINVDSQNQGSQNVVGRDYQNNGDNNLVNNNFDDINSDEEKIEEAEGDFGIQNEACNTDSDCPQGSYCSGSVTNPVETQNSTGVCVPLEVEEPEEFDIAECIANPPAGYSDSGTPLYAPGLSCKSYWQSI